MALLRARQSHRFRLAITLPGPVDASRLRGTRLKPPSSVGPARLLHATWVPPPGRARSGATKVRTPGIQRQWVSPGGVPAPFSPENGGFIATFQRAEPMKTENGDFNVDFRAALPISRVRRHRFRATFFSKKQALPSSGFVKPPFSVEAEQRCKVAETERLRSALHTGEPLGRR